MTFNFLLYIFNIHKRLEYYIKITKFTLISLHQLIFIPTYITFKQTRNLPLM